MASGQLERRPAVSVIDLVVTSHLVCLTVLEAPPVDRGGSSGYFHWEKG